VLHAVPALRAIHSVHHSAENLNFLSAFRIHLFEYIFDGLITLVPVIILGIPPAMWLPVYLSFIVLNAMQHSDIDISFGQLNRIFVSPRFHAIHHSRNRSDYSSNYGSLFTIWDILFGTAKFSASQLNSYGLPRLKIPASFFGQLVFPAAPLFYRLRRLLPRIGDRNR
jgi:sterol desaturase/sphingolipid hydroxylase (fatty acid hydroxylase superfamily)